MTHCLTKMLPLHIGCQNNLYQIMAACFEEERGKWDLGL